MPIWLETILKSDYFIWGTMAVIIFLITQVLKLPIKVGTKRIKNERVRKIVNATILLIPFGLGVLFEYLYVTYCPSTYCTIKSFTGLTGLGYGTAGISLYGVIERFFKVKIENPYTETEEGKAVTELVDKITEDKKIDSEDKSAVQQFLDKIGK